MKNISAKEALSLLTKQDAVLIDVREPDEFKAEHISYAQSMPLSNIEHDFRAYQIPKNKQIIFHCLSGIRTEKAINLIAETINPDNKILSIKGGITAWKDNGLPVITPTNAPSNSISIFRQIQMIVGLMVVIGTIFGLSGFQFGFYFVTIIAIALFFAGFSGTCMMGMMLQKMPWNK